MGDQLLRDIWEEQKKKGTSLCGWNPESINDEGVIYHASIKYCDKQGMLIGDIRARLIIYFPSHHHHYRALASGRQIVIAQVISPTTIYFHLELEKQSLEDLFPQVNERMGLRLAD